MKGTWKPYSNIIGNREMYIAGRQLDADVPLHSGNIEHSGGYTESLEEAEALCADLNGKEG